MYLIRYSENILHIPEVSKTGEFYEEANQLVSDFSIPPYADTHADLRASKLEKACPVYAHYQQVLDSLMIAHTQHLWDTMFTSCSTDDGKHLSRKDRTAMRNSSSTLIYGEIAYDSYCHIMWSALADLEEEQTLDESAVAALEGTEPYARSRHAKGGVYYDLGSGTGRALLASVLAHSFHKVVGIEILSSLHEAAEKCLSVYQDMAARGEVPSRAVELVCGSFFDYDWSDGDVVFANSTCYSDGKLFHHQIVVPSAVGIIFPHLYLIFPR